MSARNRPVRRALAALVIAGAAATAIAAGGRKEDAQAELGKALAGRIAGAPVQCIDARSVDGPEVIGDNTLIYRQSGHRLWVSTVPERCPFLHGNVVIITELFGAQLCRNTRFQTVSRNTSIPSGICRFGEFVPYDKPPKARPGG